MAANLVKFYKGTEANYKKHEGSLEPGSIWFTTDAENYKIYFEGHQYGMTEIEFPEDYATQDFVLQAVTGALKNAKYDESLHKLVFFDHEGSQIDGAEIILPLASSSVDGLMSKEDKSKLDKLSNVENIITDARVSTDGSEFDNKDEYAFKVLEHELVLNVKDPVNKVVNTAIQEVKNSIVGVYRYKGSVDNYTDLTEKESSAEVGDVWNVVNIYNDYPAGTNFAWTGEAWDSLGGTVSGGGAGEEGEIEALQDRVTAIEGKFSGASSSSGSVKNLAKTVVEEEILIWNEIDE